MLVTVQEGGEKMSTKFFLALALLLAPLVFVIGVVQAQSPTTQPNPTTTTVSPTTAPSVPSGAPSTGYGYGF